MTVVEEIKYELKKLGASEIILFGSRATGNDDTFSDYDLLVIFNEQISREKKVEVASSVRRQMAKRLIDVDILVRSRYEIEQRQYQIGSVIHTALIEGTRL